MDELIKSIYQLTVEMTRAVTEENIDELEKYLTERNTLMAQVDSLKENDPNAQYSPTAKRMLEETLRLDQQTHPQLKELLGKTGKLLQQIKVKRDISRKFNPYVKQINGAYIDTTK
ncbi:flagellar protein FliT [Neobacillus jeddahensis]|uniref:flagellar protein FliT n=1 Tax=Neobacillus jeddahensis TaxID=1461580 RepID=UPI00058ED8FF|nr:flagellar protein FliT [Neobacillus jeddahensis]